MRKVLIILGAVFLLVGCSSTSKQERIDEENAEAQKALLDESLKMYDEAINQLRTAKGFHYKATWEVINEDKEPVSDIYIELADNGLSEYDEIIYYYDATFENDEPSRMTNGFLDGIGYERREGKADYSEILNMEAVRGVVLDFRDETLEFFEPISEDELHDTEILEKENEIEITIRVKGNEDTYTIITMDRNGKLKTIKMRYQESHNINFTEYELIVYDYGDTVDLSNLDFSDYVPRYPED